MWRAGTGGQVAAQIKLLSTLASFPSNCAPLNEAQLLQAAAQLSRYQKSEWRAMASVGMRI